VILDYSKTFIAKLNGISCSRNPYQTFNDFLYMATGALYSWKKDEQAEKEYLGASKNYSPGELGKMAELLHILAEAFENFYEREEYCEGKYGDFLGHIFMDLNYKDKNNGQFFTPYRISCLMAEMAIGEKELPRNRVIRINDCCCGAGGMLIAAAMVLKKRGINYQRDAYFTGQDIDDRCARMAFIQLSLLGIPALIACGDTLKLQTCWQRETIGCHMSDIDSRLRDEAMLEKLKGLETAVPVPDVTEAEPAMPGPEERTVINLPPLREYVQGELF
jgi:type I restriction-modification system DNA methylase subunit